MMNWIKKIISKPSDRERFDFYITDEIDSIKFLIVADSLGMANIHEWGCEDYKMYTIGSVADSMAITGAKFTRIQL